MSDHDHIEEGHESSVFVSYARVDAKKARPVIDALEKAGFDVWWDGLIDGGKPFVKETEAALERALAVVVLWSENSIGSDWVRDEATRGRERHCLVPVSIDGSEPPLGFGQIQAIKAASGKKGLGASEIAKILRAVADLHNRPEPQTLSRSGLLSRIDRRAILIGGSAAALASAGFGVWKSGLIGGGPQPNSIAVLPFANLSGNPDKDYFTDGLAAEVRTELSRNVLLQVVGQTSSNEFRGRQTDTQSIASKLNVRFLLDGTVHLTNDSVKIDAALIDGRSGFNKWADSFERPLKNIFAIQGDIAQAVVTALSAQIEGSNNEQQIGGTRSVAAFDAYLRGKDLYELGIDEQSDRAALAKFEEAILDDNGYAAAYAARSRSLAVIANQYVQGSDRIALYQNAVKAAERAIQLAPMLADAHSALGYALFYGRLDVHDARGPYEKSYQLGRGNADVLARYALFLGRTGRFDEADGAIGKAAALDPLNAVTYKSKGIIDLAAGKYRDAIAADRAALAQNPKISGVHSNIGTALLQLGQLNEANDEFLRESSSLFGLPGLAITEKRRGNDGAAKAAFDKLVAQHGDDGLYQQAEVLAQWGDSADALATLDRAYASRDAGLTYLRNDALMDPVRKEPRFVALMQKIGFLSGKG